MKNITYYNAGAGSGKTYKLTEKLVEIFNEGKAAPENVILTTFTKAAAADFKVKIREKLLERGMSDFASGIEAAKMGTVHSIGLYYIRKYWYILGRSSTFVELDDDTKAVYISRTLSDIATKEDIALFNAYVEKRGLKDHGKYRYGFWKSDLTSIIEKCESFGIDDLQSCLEGSRSHIRTMFPYADVSDMLEVTERIFSIAERWKVEFKAFKEKNNLLSFNDMESLFLQLLDNPIVQQDIRSTIKYVFVDEFQDSNQTQLKIFDKLSELIDGRSYWVGDPKQAIYRFRGCDTALVSAIMKHLQSSPDEGNEYSRELDQSWRSVAPLVSYVNSTFVPLFREILPKEDVVLKAHRKHIHPDGSPALYHWNLLPRIPQGGKRATANREMLIDATAAKVRDILCGRHQIKYVVDKHTGEYRAVRPSDIAILLHKDGVSSYVTKQIEALRKYGVPVAAPESYPASRAEVCLVKVLLSYMIDSTPSLLKAEIVRLIYGKSLDSLINEGFEYDIFPALDHIRSEYSNFTVSSIVQRIIYGLNLPKHCGQWGDAESRMRVLDTIVQLARDYESSVDATLEGFVASFPQTIEVDGSVDGVHVMTYHKSKGLEWPIVILDTSSRESEKQALKRFCYGVTETRKTEPTKDHLYSDFSLRYCPNFLQASNSNVDNQVLANIKSDFADSWARVVSDGQRLFYVGATRARDYLVTLSRDKKSPEFFAECGHPIDLKNCHHQSYVDLWGNESPMVYCEDISDDQEVVIPETSNVYRAIQPSAADYVSLPRYLLPSTMEGADSEVEHVASISKRMPVRHCPSDKYDVMGTCLHHMFAIYRPKESSEVMAQMCSHVAAAYGMSEVLSDIPSVLHSMSSFYQFLTATYGPGKAYKEYPFQYTNEQGQVISGSIDLLWETSAGVVVVDYKSYSGYDDVTDSESEFFAGRKYGPQLSAYRTVADKMSGGQVIDVLLYYVVQGRVIRVR